MQISALVMERFDDEMESRFRADLTARVMPLGRLGAALGIFLFLALVPWDRHIDATALSRTMPFRWLAVIIFAGALAFTFTRIGQRSISPYMSLQVVIGLVFPILLTRLPDGFVFGVPGLILPMTVVPIFSTAMWHAGLAIGALVVLPNIVMVVSDVPPFEIVQANYWLIAGALVAGGLAYLMHVDRRRAFASQEALDAERRRSESLLLNILPAQIVERLKSSSQSTSDDFAEATVIFGDIAGFTNIAETVAAAELIDFLNELFGEFDDIVADAGIEKIKTIGDAYMAVSGVPEFRTDHAAAAVAAARRMMEAFDEVVRRRRLPLGLRIGLHSGPLIGGVIGKRKFSYDVWGDTVNVASRMESSGAPGRIQLSSATRAKLPTDAPVERRGPIELKGHTPIDAFFLHPA